MERFKKFIAERYVNAIGTDYETKSKYADEVWDILQSSYASIGGIKGSGFNSKDDMIKNIPFWKLFKKDGKVRAVIMYKDKGGRKSVAIGTDGSDEGKKSVFDIAKNELGRAYSEKSKGSLGLMLKLHPREVIEPFLKTPTQVKELLKGDEITPLSMVDKSEWPADATHTIERYPFLLKYGYLREIAGKQMFKIMMGTEGKSVKRS